MIELSLRCPKCGQTRVWKSYNVNRLDQLENVRAYCFRKKGTFLVRNNIMKVIKMEVRPNRVSRTKLAKKLRDYIKEGETSIEKLRTKIMKTGATDVDFKRGMDILHNEGIIFYPNEKTVRYNE